MFFLSYLNVSTFLIFILIGIYVYIQNPKSIIGRTFLGLSLCFGVWSLAAAVVQNPIVSKQTALLFAKIGSIGWILWIPFMIHLVLLICKIKIKSKSLLVLNWLIPILLLFSQFNGKIYSDVIKTSFGWASICKNNIYIILYNIFVFLGFIVSIALLVITKYDKKKLYLKSSVNLILISFIIAGTLGIITNVIIANFVIPKFPRIAHLFFSIIIVFFGYGILKLNLFVAPPDSLAENITKIMGEGLVLTDSHFSIRYTNQAFENMIGNDGNQLSEKKLYFFDFVPDVRAIQKSKNFNIKNLEVIIHRLDGKKIRGILSALPINKEIHLGAVFVLKSTEEYYKILEKVEKDKRALENQNKNLSTIMNGMSLLANNLDKIYNIKSQFLSGIGYEIKDPLDELYNQTELLKITSLDNEQNELLEMIQVSELQLRDVIIKVLKYSNLTKSGLIKKTTIFNLKKRILKITNDSADKFSDNSNTFNLEFDNSLPEVFRGNEDGFSDSFKEIIENAFKFTSNGQIIITLKQYFNENCKQVEESGFSSICLKCSIEDNGIGIDSSFKNKIFEDFFQISNKFSRKYQGIGLGLSIAKNNIENMGGRIWVKTNPDAGVTINYYFRLFINK